MIIDVHSQTWQYPEHFTDQFCHQAAQVAKAHPYMLQRDSRRTVGPAGANYGELGKNHQ